MDRLYTITRLYAFGLLVDKGDKIKIHLDNGEILIGDYSYSDNYKLFIMREDDNEVMIDFDDIEKVERI